MYLGFPPLSDIRSTSSRVLNVRCDCFGVCDIWWRCALSLSPMHTAIKRDSPSYLEFSWLAPAVCMFDALLKYVSA